MAQGALTALSPFAFSTGAGTSPYGITASPDNKNVYAVLNDLPGIAQMAVDATTGQLSAIPGKPLTLSTNSKPMYARVSPDGRHVYVCVTGYDIIHIFSRDQTDGSLTSVQAYSSAEVAGPVDIAISPDNLFAYVTNRTTSTVAQYSRNTSTGLLTPLSTATITTGTGSQPYGIVTSQADNGAGVYVACSQTNVVYCFNRNTTTGLLTAAASPTIATASNFPNQLVITDDDKFVYVTSDSGQQLTSVYSRNASTNALTALASPPQTVDNNGGPWGITLSRDAGNTALYLAVSDVQRVAQYTRDPSTGALTPNASGGSVFTSNRGASNTSGGGPYSVVSLANNKFAYATDLPAGTISQFSIEQGVTTSTVLHDFAGSFAVSTTTPTTTVTSDFGGSFSVASGTVPAVSVSVASINTARVVNFPGGTRVVTF